MRFEELTKEMLDAETVDSVKLVAEDVDRSRGVVGENRYNTLRSVLRRQMDKVGKKKLMVKVGPLEAGGEKEGKLP
jgi:hypothetical protein